VLLKEFNLEERAYKEYETNTFSISKKEQPTYQNQAKRNDLVETA